MRKLFSVFLLTLLISILISIFGSPMALADQDSISTKSVKVNGMVCAFCAQGIEKKFKAEEAVSQIKVSLENHLVELEFKEGKTISNERIEKLLKDSGYTVEQIL